MKKIIFVVLCLLIGCGSAMSRRDQIRAILECERSGLKAQMIYSAWTNTLVDIECVPKENNIEMRVTN